MRFRASHRFAPSSASKARLVVNLIREKSANEALEVLQFTNNRPAVLIDKVLRSAIANAGLDVDPETLWVQTARVDDGPTWPPRWKSGGRGRAMPIHKHTCHITIELSDQKEEA
ncbi:MAG TPA: 50S ribosomal protein L22 [Planctomycetota bacterium]|nr:50S ribosomal protein L22 [Planctomycetota bacterium]